MYISSFQILIFLHKVYIFYIYYMYPYLNFMKVVIFWHSCCIISYLILISYPYFIGRKYVIDKKVIGKKNEFSSYYISTEKELLISFNFWQASFLNIMQLNVKFQEADSELKVTRPPLFFSSFYIYIYIHKWKVFLHLNFGIVICTLIIMIFVSYRMLYYYSVLGYMQLDWVSTVQRVALVSLVATLVESLPISDLIDDNISVPLAAMAMTFLSFRH